MVNASFLLALSLDSVLNVLYVAMGIGLVIFFHELGHFAVAKWCDVNVERFSIGFGPVLWRIKRGETEYVLSAVPFGGYVKMLGQDDIDPSQLSSEEIAEDPRSYSAKPVASRMAIISAGVIMNVITGFFFYAGAYVLGIESAQPVVGVLEVGMPAWEAGIQHGDKITRVNGDSISSFEDIVLSVALSRKDRRLFTLPGDSLGKLAAGPITADLRSAFARQDVPLPHDTQLVADMPQRWFIMSGQNQLFAIEQTGKNFSVSGNLLEIEGERAGKKIVWNIVPDGTGTNRKIGLGPSRGMRIASDPKQSRTAMEGSAAALATPAFKDQDHIKQIDETPIASTAEMRQYLARFADRDLVYHVERQDQSSEHISVPAQRFRTLGLSMDIERITAIRHDCPAATAGLRVGDKLITVNGRDVGKDINPLELPNLFAHLHGQAVNLELLREQEGGSTETVKTTVTPDDIPGWSSQPGAVNASLAIPALGIAYQSTVHILSVVPGSPADQAGIKPGEQVRQIELTLASAAASAEPQIEIIKFDESQKTWARAFWLMQMTADGPVKLTVVGDDGQERPLQMTPWRNPQRDWFLPNRGLLFYTLTEVRAADSVGSTVGLAYGHAHKTLSRIWVTLRNLFTGDLSVTELHGPIGIARAAYSMASDSQARLLLFLGFLSFNLAVLNFLPIPVLDGGHMCFLCWEAVTRRRPSERVLIGATYCGLAFVLLLMVTVIFLDLKRIPIIKQLVENTFG